jgi:hypothetical protein
VANAETKDCEKHRGSKREERKQMKYLLSIMLLLGAKGPSSGCYPNNLKGQINVKANDGSLASPKETLKREI